jgi:hypothetical protein
MVLLDDPRPVQQLRTYLKWMGYKRGLLFRAGLSGEKSNFTFESSHKVRKKQ